MDIVDDVSDAPEAGIDEENTAEPRKSSIALDDRLEAIPSSAENEVDKAFTELAAMKGLAHSKHASTPDKKNTPDSKPRSLAKGPEAGDPGRTRSKPAAPKDSMLHVFDTTNSRLEKQNAHI